MRGKVNGTEFKHSDVCNVTDSRRVAPHDINAKRVFEIYSGGETYSLDEPGH